MLLLQKRFLFYSTFNRALTLKTKRFVHSLRAMSMADGDANNDNKKARMQKKIGTHNGTFHCDEVLACVLLKKLPEYSDAEIIRTRDPKLLETCDVVVDVGGVYDPSKHRYDHHQRSFNECMNSLNSTKPWDIKLSSAGLVYLHFGHKVIAEMLDTQPHDKITDIIYNRVYENFIQEIDAIDNGISAAVGKPRYSISTNLSSRVGKLNPHWNSTEPKPDQGFFEAYCLVGTEFNENIHYFHQVWWPARKLLQDAIDNRFEVDQSGAIILLSQGGFPWKEHLFMLEEEMGLENSIKFVLYTDQNQSWRVQCVPVRKDSFENRLSLKEEWQGLRDEELSKVSDIADCVFVHASGFIGGNKAKQGALEMARKTLQDASQTV